MKQTGAAADSVLPESDLPKERTAKMKNTLLLIGLILAGSIVGALTASLAGNISALSWLAYSKGISIAPTDIDLSLFNFTFGIGFSISVAQIIFIIAAIAVYPKLKKMIA